MKTRSNTGIRTVPEVDFWRCFLYLYLLISITILFSPPSNGMYVLFNGRKKSSRISINDFKFFLDEPVLLEPRIRKLPLGMYECYVDFRECDNLALEALLQIDLLRVRCDR